MHTAKELVYGMVEDIAWLRESIGNAPLLKTANKLADELGKGDIPHVIVGGLAVQEHGYVRFTSDVDVVVPDVDTARDYLSIRGFQEVTGTRSILKDWDNKVRVDLLPGGGSVGPTLVKLPMPTEVSRTPVFLGLAELISQKLGTYLKNRLSRVRDLSDVVELIKVNRPFSSLPVDAKVKREYRRILTGLKRQLWGS